MHTCWGPSFKGVKHRTHVFVKVPKGMPNMHFRLTGPPTDPLGNLTVEHNFDLKRLAKVYCLGGVLDGAWLW